MTGVMNYEPPKPTAPVYTVTLHLTETERLNLIQLSSFGLGR